MKSPRNPAGLVVAEVSPSELESPDETKLARAAP